MVKQFQLKAQKGHLPKRIILNSWFDNTCKTEKQNFNLAKHEYSRCRSDSYRANVTKYRPKLNKAKRRAKATCKFEEGQRVTKLPKSKPKQFWKEIKKFVKQEGQTSDSLPADNFFETFSSDFQTNTNEYYSENIHVEENTNFTSDCPLTNEELKNVILPLKTNKSLGLDGLISEVFKCSYDVNIFARIIVDGRA